MHFTRAEENLIASLRGIPPNTSRSKWREAKPMDSLMEVIIQQHKFDQPRPENLIIRHWRDIMGQEDAHRCAPVRLDRGTRLIVSVPNPTLRRELLFKKRHILKRLRQIPGMSGVKDIYFRTG